MKLNKKELDALNRDTLEFLSALTEDELVALFQHLSFAYYNTGKPIVSDDVFDLVRGRLEEIAPSHAVLRSVGACVADDDGRKERLPVWMGSLDKIKLGKELDRFKSKFKDCTYVISDKLDGISALYVASSRRSSLYTRGDGEFGQNISHLLPFIKGIPKESRPCLVRGELIITKKDFEKEGKGANARNTVAGLVNAKVPDLQIARITSFVAYQMIRPDDLRPSEQVDALKRFRFRDVWSTVISSSAMTLDALSRTLAERKENSEYEIDGLVVVHDAIHNHADKRNPDSAFAFKATQETAEVFVSDVIWQVSKDGLLKPVVVFDAVALSGVQIRRATGFNADFIESNKIGPGSKLLITRSGDVIPFIMKVLKASRSGKGSLPTDREYDWVGKDIKIVGKSHEQDVKQLEFFFEKLDIKGIRGGTVKRLYENGITDVKTFIALTETDLAPPFRNKWPMIENAIAAIKSAPCVKLMHASNAFGQGFGERKLGAIVKDIPRILTSSIDVDELEKVEGVSTSTAEKFLIGLDAFKRFMEETGLRCAEPQDKPTNKTDLVVVFTGFRNKEWETIIKDSGGSIGTGITSKTNLLVAKDIDDDSAKIKEARAKNVRVMSMSEFEATYIVKMRK